MYSRDEILHLIKSKRKDHGTYYDYSELVGVPFKKSKVLITCPVHGRFDQVLTIHLLNSGCKKCKSKNRQLSKLLFLDKIKLSRTDQGMYYDYSLVPEIIGNNKVRIPIICPEHGLWYQFAQDHMRNFSCQLCGTAKRHDTNIKTYGKDYKKIFYTKSIDTVRSLYGVDNVSQHSDIKKKKSDTCFSNHGVEHYFQSDISKLQIKQTNLLKYGVEYVSQNVDIKNKILATKIRNGSFNNSNCSKEARLYFREYLKYKKYHKSQLAYSDPENGLFEWGYNVNGKWILYDFVAFELGYRGDKDKIIEIIEYHGPFHYNDVDVIEKGDEMAYPWKSKKTTIKESRQNDLFKEEFARSLTKNFNVIWWCHTSSNERNTYENY